ncbi:hypothetical protein [Ehrlichia ruminantium]|nr:hypothetical protein [Ehrlichia ruminantium]QLK52473.1 hypothetical protein FDZ65_03070 [Ehrlichia ruminantium]QLK54303.1 hypothetical protein FDZ63_03070 [Ehrlichia ruminantium]QLK57056.1 hypothetical protein FDZ60_03080 [Ehrlichia ruminantium]UOD97541.1 hypothetical protein IMW64_03025 [Ehrlichia ruminantium]
MLFKYNPENNKQLHDKALQCLRNLKIYAHSDFCVGTEINGVLNVIINKINEEICVNHKHIDHCFI